MKDRRSLFSAALAAAAVLTSVPARAQFDPLHNHLKCYRIASRVQGGKTVTLNDQFGTAVAAVLKPFLLCTPTQKICDTPGGCPPDPEPAVPVRHFKCYKVKVPRSAAPPSVQLIDQFGNETVKVGPALLLCTPAVKIPVGETTTTTTTVTTTTQPFCHLENTAGPPICAGSCTDPNAACKNIPSVGCRCVNPPSPCGGDATTGCGGLCENTAQSCILVGTTCQCANPVPCGQTAPACDGQCPAGTTCGAGATGGCACK